MTIRDLIARLQKDLPTSTCDALSNRINELITPGLRNELQPISSRIDQQNTRSVAILDSIGTHFTSQVKNQQALESNLIENMGKLRSEVQLLRTTVATSCVIIEQPANSGSNSTEQALIWKENIDPREKMVQA
jgi:hypothetical protein